MAKRAKAGLLGFALGALQGVAAAQQRASLEEAEARREARLAAIRQAEQAADRDFRADEAERERTARAGEREADRALTREQLAQAGAHQVRMARLQERQIDLASAQAGEARRFREEQERRLADAEARREQQFSSTQENLENPWVTYEDEQGRLQRVRLNDAVRLQVPAARILMLDRQPIRTPTAPRANLFGAEPAATFNPLDPATWD